VAGIRRTIKVSRKADDLIETVQAALVDLAGCPQSDVEAFYGRLSDAKSDLYLYIQLLEEMAKVRPPHITKRFH
jgi:hypothetical protein